MITDNTGCGILHIKFTTRKSLNGDRTPRSARIRDIIAQTRIITCKQLLHDSGLVVNHDCTDPML